MPQADFMMESFRRGQALLDAFPGRWESIEEVVVGQDALDTRDPICGSVVVAYLEVEISSMIRAEIREYERTLWFLGQVSSLTSDFSIQDIYGTWPIQGFGQIEGMHYYIRIKDHAGFRIGESDEEAVTNGVSRTPRALDFRCLTDFADTPVAWQQLGYLLVWSIRQEVAASTCARGHQEPVTCELCDVHPDPFIEQPKWALPEVNTDLAQREADIAAEASIDAAWQLEVQGYLSARRSATTQLERDEGDAAHRESLERHNAERWRLEQRDFDVIDSDSSVPTVVERPDPDLHPGHLQE